MNWRATFDEALGRRPKGVDTSQIPHAQIFVPTREGQVAEHLFFNTHTASPIAAVSCKLSGQKLELNLYSREGKFDETTRALAEAELAVRQEGAPIVQPSRDACASYATIHGVSHRLIGAEDNVTLAPHGTPSLDLANDICALEKSDLLGGDKAQRHAFVRKMYETIPGLETAVQRAMPREDRPIEG